MVYSEFLYGETLYERQSITGYRIIPVTVPLALGMATVVNISWQAATPPNTRITVEVSKDNGDSWERLYNQVDSAIVFQTEFAGTKDLLIKTTLETTNLIAIPRLFSLSVNIAQIATLYRLAYDVLTDAGFPPEDYWIDPELLEYAIPHAWIKRGSHRDALEQIIKACIGHCYVCRDNRILIQGPSYRNETTDNITIDADSYYKKSTYTKEPKLANYIEVYANPLFPSEDMEVVYKSSKPVSILAGETKTITTFYTAFYTQNPVINCIASLKDAPMGAAITHAEYYAWGAKITITSTEAGSFTLVINGTPLKVKGRTRAEASDDASIQKNGVFSYKFPANHLVQTAEMAQKIADTLLEEYMDPTDHLELTYRGNPALEIDNIVSVDSKEYIVKTHELTFDGTLKGKIIDKA